MKKVLMLVVALFSLSAMAGEIKLYDRPTWEMGRVGDVRKTFEINPELGRAWVKLTFVPDYTQDSPEEELRVKAEGLSYNADTREVVLDAEGAQIVCATVKKNFFGVHVKETGACKFSEKFYKVKVDDGFEIKTVEKLKILMTF